MCKAICHVCAAVVLAAAGLCLTHGLFKRRDAGEVLRIERHIVKSQLALSAVLVMGRETRKGAVVSVTISGTRVSTKRYRPSGRSETAL